MKIVTSFNPNARIERQEYCLSTWKAYGLPIVAMQTDEELQKLEQLFDRVTWKESIFTPPRIVDMCRLAIDEPILLINSDISIKNTVREFRSDWIKCKPQTLKLGIRFDRYSNGQKKLIRYGIDAFRITPDMAMTLPELDFRIGQPVWDFWLTWHFYQLGYQIETKKSLGLIHEFHKPFWTDGQHKERMQIMESQYGVEHLPLAKKIQELTKRK